jgi:preprotein translocase subunit SecG
MIMILLTVVHVIVCLFLILVVLLQQGKSADWSGTFGGGSSQTAFGQRGTATVLSKATTAAAIIFMVTSLALTIVSSTQGGRSVVPVNATTPATTTPAPTTTPPAEAPKAAEPAKDATPAAPAPAPEPAKDAAPAGKQEKSSK